jgi:ferredoxin-NADP reductase
MSSGIPASTAMATVFSERRSDLVITAREVLGEGVVSLTLADPTGAELPAWTPGAHIDVLLDDSLVRQYSLCGPPADQHSWRIGVLLDPASRGGSRRVHDLQVGDQVAVRGPRNHFPLVAADRHIFIAGGIGITPILPMLEAATEAGSDWQLYYGGRSRRSMAFLDELSRHGDRVSVCPEDEKGLLPLADILGTPSDGVLIYCCGPEGLLTAVEQRCTAWPPGALRLERFAAKEQPTQVAGGDSAFQVVCQRSGVTVTVPPDTSIIDALERDGVSVLSSCLEGVCGTCETAVLEGVPDHRDSLLTEDERQANEYMMICVSRSKSERLVLDL